MYINHCVHRPLSLPICAHARLRCRYSTAVAASASTLHVGHTCRTPRTHSANSAGQCVSSLKHSSGTTPPPFHSPAPSARFYYAALGCPPGSPRLPTALLPQIACGVSPFAISSRSTPLAPPHDTRVHPACTPFARVDVRESSWLGFGSLLVHQVAASNESVSQEPLGCNTQLHTAAAGTCCCCCCYCLRARFISDRSVQWQL